MDYQAIVSVISNIGFPIVMCLIVVNIMLKQNESHREEMSKITESLNNNTNALIQLTAKLDVYAGSRG